MTEIHEQIDMWLKAFSYKVQTEDRKVSKFLQRYPNIRHSLIVQIPSSQMRFRVIFDHHLESFNFQMEMEFTKEDKKSFLNLKPSLRQKFFAGIKKVVYPFGLNLIIKKENIGIIIVKTFFVENLNRQYFFDSLFSFIHALELIAIVYTDLSSSLTPINPTDMT